MRQGETAQRRVLVAEAEPGIGTLLDRFLRLSGYTVEVADGLGAARARLAGPSRPHLVLLDLARPDAESLAFCRDICTPVSPVPVIAMTAAVYPDARRRVLGAGCAYVIEKPFDPDALEALLHDALTAPPPSRRSSAA